MSDLIKYFYDYESQIRKFYIEYSDHRAIHIVNQYTIDKHIKQWCLGLLEQILLADTYDDSVTDVYISRQK